MVTTPLTSFGEIRTEWESLLAASPVNTLFLTPQWQEVWWESYGASSGMAGFYVRSTEGVTAVAPLAKQGDTLSFVGNQDTFDYNDFMVSPGTEGEFYHSLLHSIEEQCCKSLELYSLRESSPTLKYLPEAARSHGFKVEVEKEDVTSGIELPGTWDEYLALLNKKDRHELRRKLRRLDSANKWSFYGISEPEQVTARLGDFISLMKMSSPDKEEYMTEDRERFFYQMAERMAQQGLLKLYFMDIDGQTVATSLCFDYASSRLLYNSGYNQEFSYYSVGLLLNALCLKDAIEQGMSYFDFLRGPEPYKHHLGGQQQDLYQMVVTRS